MHSLFRRIDSATISRSDANLTTPQHVTRYQEQDRRNQAPDQGDPHPDRHAENKHMSYPFFDKHALLSHEIAQEQSEEHVIHRSRSNPVAKNKILLLQGPIGPFFGSLQEGLENAGFHTKRVLFHAADALYTRAKNVVRFSGDIKLWEAWLRNELNISKPDAIVLFGSSRPAHQTARKLAQECGIEIVALEEGYLRAGYITCELGGNNHHSPLTRWTSCQSHVAQKEPIAIGSSFFIMCVWGACYYLWRELTKRETEQALYHRKTNGVRRESVAWTAHVIRKIFARFQEKYTIFDLVHNHQLRYILVPLQTPSDSQMRIASRGWNSEKLIRDCLHSIHKTKNNNIIVFKTHPLDENAHELAAHILQEARKLKIEKNIRVLRTGKIGELTKNSSGVIVINSTSAFSALSHNVPLLVLGDAIFRHPDVATLGKDSNCVHAFLQKRVAKRPEAVTSFIRAVKSNALLPGDFYALSSQRVTTLHIVDKIRGIVDGNTNCSETEL